LIKRAIFSSAKSDAKVVFPVPGGPQKINEGEKPFSIS
tara:strand:+ start:1076 stop:1189 length:114 start_codon:yes stop_codon:yes gene_type:complete